MKRLLLYCILLLIPCGVMAQNRVIIDYKSPGYFERGTWTTGSIGGGNRTTNIEGSIIKIRPNLPKAGRWKVSFMGIGASYSTHVVIYHNGKRENLTYTSYDTNTTDKNYTVGSAQGYEFDAATNEFIGITTLETWTRFRGVVFDLLEEKTVVAPTTYADSVYYTQNEADFLDLTSSSGFKVTTDGWRLSLDPFGLLPGEPYHLFTTNTSEQIAEWHPEIKHTGTNARVKVYVYTPVTPRDLAPAPVTYELISPSDPTQNKSVTYSKKEGNGWKHLGDFHFSGDGNEYVRVKRVAGTSSLSPTRISCIKFEQWSPGQGGVDILWQTTYVNANDPKIPVTVPSIDLTDMAGNPVKFYIEQMCNKGLIDYNNQNNLFDPSTTVTAQQFVGMINKAIRKQSSDIRILTMLDALTTQYGLAGNILKRHEAVKLLIDELIPALPQNKEWHAGTISEFNKYKDFFSLNSNMALKSLYNNATRQGILNRAYYNRFDPNLELTREYAAMLIKGILDVYFWSTPSPRFNWTLRYQEEFDNVNTFWRDWESENSCPGHIFSGRFKENVIVEDGKLKLLVKQESPEKICPDGKTVEWTTGSVSNNFFKQRYGYWEARYKYIDASSLNQSFWMNAGWGFEIDVNEGHYPNLVNTTLHYVDGEISRSNGNQTKINEDLSKDYHTFACFWRPDSIFYYCDNVEIARKKSYNAQKPVYPRFSLAILSWAGAIKQEMSGKTMDCEWVRVYTVNQQIDVLTGGHMQLSCNSDPQPITIEFKDEGGRPITGAPVTFANVKKNDATFTFDGATMALTDAQGRATVYIRGGRFEGRTRVSIATENNVPHYVDVTVTPNDMRCVPPSID